MPKNYSPKEITERKDRIAEQLKAGFIPDLENENQAARQTEALEFIAVALGVLVQKVDQLKSATEKLQPHR